MPVHELAATQQVSLSTLISSAQVFLKNCILNARWSTMCSVSQARWASEGNFLSQDASLRNAVLL